MMQWILSLIVTLLSWGNPAVLSENTAVTSPPPQNNADLLKYNGIDYDYLLNKDIEPSRFVLVANFEEHKSSLEISRENNCEAGANGGFYDNLSRPIGLFITGGKFLSKAKDSLIFNGFVSIDNSSRLEISENPPLQSRFATQTGPILIADGRPRTLDLARDKPARRIIFAKDSLGKAVLLAIYVPNAELLGPTLGDLPRMVEMISKKENLSIQAAVNLDGGSASAFLTRQESLEESEPIGSWWCIKVE